MNIARLAERLLFAKRYYDQFAAVSRVATYCRYSELEGRSLSTYKSPWRQTSWRPGRVANESEYELYGEFRIDQFADNLQEIVEALLMRLFEKFDFTEISSEVYKRAIDDLLARRF